PGGISRYKRATKIDGAAVRLEVPVAAPQSCDRVVLVEVKGAFAQRVLDVGAFWNRIERDTTMDPMIAIGTKEPHLILHDRSAELEACIGQIVKTIEKILSLWRQPKRVDQFGRQVVCLKG